MLILDTNVCVEIIRGRAASVAAEYDRADPDSILLPSIVAGELLFGALKSSHVDAVAKAEAFIAGHELIPFGAEEMRAYSRLRCDLEMKGFRIGGNDLIIAAPALTLGATLVTHNAKEFGRVMGLRLADWQS